MMLNKIINAISFGLYAKLKKKRSSQRQKQQMKLYGKTVLDIVKEVSNRQNKPFWLEMGTLLGAYREKNFIDHDYDIDLGMYQDDYDIDFENALIECGFKKDHLFYQYRDTGEVFLTEVSWTYQGVGFDIFLSKKNETRRSVFLYGKKDEESFNRNKWEVNEYVFPQAFPMDIVEIQGTRYNSPCNPKCCLIIYYGESFMTPDPNASATDKTDRSKIWDINKSYAKITWVK